jgi:hypothetical protein
MAQDKNPSSGSTPFLLALLLLGSLLAFIAIAASANTN